MHVLNYLRILVMKERTDAECKVFKSHECNKTITEANNQTRKTVNQYKFRN